MGNWIIVPVVLPAVVAPLIVLFARYDPVLQRVFSMGSAVALLAVAVALWVAAGAGPEAYRIGSWPAPFGIVLVLDRLAALMLLLTAVLGIAVGLYAICGFDQGGRHFHALLQFQLMGINGAFLTGDLFNLFVFFEVLLIASYGLLLHGAGARALRAGFHYVAVNLAGSTLFLFAVGLIYAVTGTLNMADLVRKLPLVPAEEQALVQVGGLLLLVVFLLKAALVPLHFWLPAAYGATGAPVAALFAIMTKVGAYAILRVHGAIFAGAGQRGDWLADRWLIPVALATVTVGMFGVLAARRLREQACYALIGSMGTLLVAIGLFSPAGTAAALYYLASSTLGAAIMFLVVDLLATCRGTAVGRAAAPAARGVLELIAGFYFLAAVLMAGMPPLSGFLGKVMILDAARSDPRAVAIWTVTLVTTLVALVGFARSGSAIFWKGEADPGSPRTAQAGARPAAFVAVGGLLGAVAALTMGAGPAMAVLEAVAVDLHDPTAYVTAVLGPPAGASAP